MRATMRITWLLLSLSFLFHSVCSDDVSQTDPSASNNTTSVMTGSNVAPAGGNASDTQLTTDSKSTPALSTRAPTTGDDGKSSSTIPAPTTAKPTATVTAAQISVAAASKSTDKPVTSQATTVKEKPAKPPTNISDTAPAEKNDSSPAAATPSQPMTLTPTATSDSNGSSVVAASPATVQTSETSGSSNTSGTEAPAVSPGNTTNVETTKMPNASTDALSSGKQSMTQTTTTSKTSQEDSKGGIEGVTETVTSPKQNSSSPPDSAGNPGTTSIPSNPTKDGPPLTDPLGTKAGTTSLQTTPTPTKTTTKATTTTTTTATATTTTTTTTATTAAQLKTFSYSLNKGDQGEKELAELCRQLMVNLKDGNCSLAYKHSNGTKKFDRVEINGMVKTDLASQYYEEITKVKKPTDNRTLIAILASCGALLIMIVILAVCASHHRKPYNENQQHLTEELHTVENGYHDNPTLEVMEVHPEMLEKKMVLNGEFNDSWIVPIDNLLKEDMPDEEDTHL